MQERMKQEACGVSFFVYDILRTFNVNNNCYFTFTDFVYIVFVDVHCADVLPGRVHRSRSDKADRALTEPIPICQIKYMDGVKVLKM